MSKFGKVSAARLGRAHTLLQKLFNKVIEYTDCTVIETDRSPEQQAINIAKEVSWTMDSKHLRRPSEAADVAFYPLDWGITGTPEQKEAAIRKHYWFAGVVMGIAFMLKIKVRWGGDWDSDHNLAEEKRKDLVHFEVIP